MEEEEISVKEQLAPIRAVVEPTNAAVISCLLNVVGFIEDFREYFELPDITYEVCIMNIMLCRAVQSTTIMDVYTSAMCCYFVNIDIAHSMYSLQMLKEDVQDGNLQKSNEVTKCMTRILRGFYAKDRNVLYVLYVLW